VSRRSLRNNRGTCDVIQFRSNERKRKYVGRKTRSLYKHVRPSATIAVITLLPFRISDDGRRWRRLKQLLTRAIGKNERPLNRYERSSVAVVVWETCVRVGFAAPCRLQRADLCDFYIDFERDSNFATARCRYIIDTSGGSWSLTEGVWL